MGNSYFMKQCISPEVKEMVSNNVSVNGKFIAPHKKHDTFNTRRNKNKSNTRMNRRTHRIHQPGRTNCTQRYQGK